MVSKGALLLMCHGLVWAAAIAFWAGGGVAGAAARYDTATPFTPPYNRHRYIPLHSDRYESNDLSPVADDDQPQYSYTIAGMAPSELLLTGLRTILDVVRKVNKQKTTSKKQLLPGSNSTAVAFRKSQPKNGTGVETGRGMDDYYDEHHDYHTTTTAKPVKQGRYTDPWAGYYDWIINEGSFKFWSAFQLFTAALLLYACFSAIYYAKFNPILPDYSMEYDDYFLQRTIGRNARSIDASELPSGVSWISPQTFQFIMNAINLYNEFQ